MLSPRWRKVYRDLWNNKGRTMLVVSSIAVGVIAFGGLFATRTNLLLNLDDDFVQSAPFDVEIGIANFDDDIVRWAARQPGVLDAQGFALYAEEIITDDDVFDVSIYAYDSISDVSVNRITAEAGIFPPPRDEVAVERSFIEKLGVDVGDTLTFEIGDEEIYTLPVAGTVHDVNAQPGFISDVIRVYASTRTLYGMGLSADYNTLYLRVDRAAAGDLAAFADGIADDLERLGVLVTGVGVVEEQEHWAADNVAGITAILLGVGSLSLILSGFLVINTISGLLAQQQKQIGIMKIIGASRPQIIAIYVALVAVFGVLAVVVALPLSSAVARAITLFLGRDTLNANMDILTLPSFIIAVEIIVALMAPLIFAVGPVLSGTGITAREAISDYNPSVSNNPIDVLLAKLSGLPTPMLLSVRNTFRRKIRLLMTMITLVLAGAVFMAIVNVRQSVREDVSELVQMTNYDVGFTLTGYYNSDGLQRRVQETPGVAATEGWLSVSVNRVRPGNIEGEGIGLIGVPHNSSFIIPDIKEGVWLSDPNDINRFDLVINHLVLESEPDLKVGDTITLDYNGDEQDFNIIGVVWGNDAPGLGGSPVYTYYETVERFSGLQGQANQLNVGTTQSNLAFQQQIESDLFVVLERLDVDVQSTLVLAEQTDALLDAFDIIISLLLITAIIIAIVGGLGLAGTMSLSVLERTREIGVMRSVGASTNALRLMFVAEGTIIGLLSAVVSVILSFATTYGFGQLLGIVVRERPFSYILTFAAPMWWLLIILVVSAVASVLPAQNATQISIREAISYE
ncbi:MAG: ABC transporter permease [Chloroflexota bacterium]